MNWGYRARSGPSRSTQKFARTVCSSRRTPALKVNQSQFGKKGTSWPVCHLPRVQFDSRARLWVGAFCEEIAFSANFALNGCERFLRSHELRPGRGGEEALERFKSLELYQPRSAQLSPRNGSDKS
jgi:hypothetical protein